MPLPKRKKRHPLSPDNLFHPLDSSHFNNGILNKKGTDTLLSYLHNRNAKLLDLFGESGAELFIEYYNSDKEDKQFLTSFARDIIITNSILYDEELEGPDSSLVRQVDQLFSLIKNREAVTELKKLLLKLSIIPEHDLSFVPAYNSFMDLYLRASASHRLKFDILSHTVHSILSLSRLKLSGLREFDRIYSSALDKNKKKLVVEHSREYLVMLKRGIFSSPMSLLNFFSERRYTIEAFSLQSLLLRDLSRLSEASESYAEKYEDYHLSEDHTHERLKDFQEQLKKGLLRLKK